METLAYCNEMCQILWGYVLAIDYYKCFMYLCELRIVFWLSGGELQIFLQKIKSVWREVTKTNPWTGKQLWRNSTAWEIGEGGVIASTSFKGPREKCRIV